jgi:invasion protein IalB
MRKILLALLAASSTFGAASQAFADTPIQLDSTSWTKACKADAGDAGRRVCLTSAFGKLPASDAKNPGQISISAILIEREGDDRKTLRVVLPLGMQLVHGTRVIIDNQKPIPAPYVNCYSGGCFSDYALNGDLLESLKTGNQLTIQAINSNGSPLGRTIPLPRFGKAFSGSPDGWNSLDADVRNSLDAMLMPKSVVDKVDSASRLIYAPWTKFCLKGQDANAKQVCFTGKDARLESGQSVIAAVIIEPEGEPKKILRVTVPLGIQLVHGTRVTVDDNAPAQSPYVICFQNGCMSDYQAPPELIAKLKNGENLVVQAINSSGAPVTLRLPLQETGGASFAKAYDGPPTDPKIFVATQQKLQGELAARAAEARKDLADQSQAPPPLAAAPSEPIHEAPAIAGRPASFGRRVALVVGNSAYKSVAALTNPIRDAAKVAETLRKVGFQSVDLETDLSREGLVEALRGFAKQAENADWAVVYYAGHGIEAAGVNYLIPVDAAIHTDRDISLEAVPIDQVLNSAERARALRLVILDACRDNPFADQMKRTMSVASRSVSRGLAQMEPDPGTLVIFAAKHGETALDGDGGNSPFVTAFAKDIQVPGVEVRRLFDNVRDDVMDMTGKRQQPYAYGSVPGRQDFYFVAK